MQNLAGKLLAYKRDRSVNETYDGRPKSYSFAKCRNCFAMQNEFSAWI